MLDQGFLDVALHPLVKNVSGVSVLSVFSLSKQRRGVRFLQRDSGWHGDAWYDQTRTTECSAGNKLASI